MNSFWILVKKELLEQWRTNKLLVVGIVFLFFGLISPLTAKYTPELIKSLGGGIEIKMPTPTAKDALDQLVKNVSQFGILAAILISMSTVAREKERGTAAMVLTKPVTRWAFLATKFIGLVVTLGVGIVVAGAAAYFYTYLLFEALPLGGFVLACGLLLVVLLVFAAITLLGSTLVNSPMAAAGLGIAAWIGLGLGGIIPKVGDWLPTSLFAPAQQLSLGQNVTNLAAPLAVSLAAIAACLGVAWWSFRGQEL